MGRVVLIGRDAAAGIGGDDEFPVGDRHLHAAETCQDWIPESGNGGGDVQVQRFRDLIEWTRALHQRLGDRLDECAARHEDQRTQWLMTYVASHQRTLVTLVSGFVAHAEEKVLDTWIYDYLDHPVIDPHTSCDQPYSGMTFDEIVKVVLGLHNEAVTLYRDLASRAEIPEARDLLEHLRDMEEQHGRLMAQQANRIRDL